MKFEYALGLLNKFDLERAKAGEDVIDGRGRPVKLIYFDKKGDYPLVGLVDSGPHKEEFCVAFTERGWYSLSNILHDMSLYMKHPPKEKLIPFNLPKALNGYRIRTRDGRDAFILLDANTGPRSLSELDPLLGFRAAIKDKDGQWLIRGFNVYGQVFTTINTCCSHFYNDDLFMAHEKETEEK